MHPAAGVIFIYFLTANAGPLLVSNTPPWRCVESCKENATTIDLGDSQTHIYQFKIIHHITSPLNEAERNLYVIQGNAVIVGSPNCNYQLKLNNVEVYGEANGQRTPVPDFIEQLEKRPLRFGYDNGEVTGFCPSVEENKFSWNIKAALLSALQVQPESLSLPTKLTEEDVSGLCITEYTPQFTEGSLNGFLKTKYTAGCAKKYNFKTIFTGVDQQYPMTYARTNSIDGNRKCEVKLEVGGPVTSSQCSEKLVVRGVLDLNWNEINRVLVTTSLDLISTEESKNDDYESSEEFMRTTLSHHALETTSGKTASQFSLNEQLDTEVLIDRLVNGEMRYFQLLVANLRGSSLEELSTLMNKHPDFSPESKIIYEAAIYAKTNASYGLLQKGINEDKFPIPLLKLSLLPDPALKEIRYVEETLRGRDFSSRSKILSILLKRFCSAHPDCQNMPEAVEIASVWESYLLTNYDGGTMGESDMPLHAIQAIGNLGAVFKKETIPVLVQIMDPKNSLDSRLRVAAAQSFRNFPSDENVDEILLDVFEDKNVDCELRIDAYRSWVRNLDAAKIFKLNKILEFEQSDQVKSYVASHLAALNRTEDSELLKVRGLIQTYIDPKWLESSTISDVYKYSKYFEYMFSSQKLSGKVQASVIYGPSSAQPRSVSLNVTVNVGGRLYNVLDVNYRSTGPLFLQKLYALYNKASSGTRIGEEFDPKESPQDKRTSLAVRMFGNEFIYLDDLEKDFFKLGELINPNGVLFTVDEATSLLTSGGLMLETGFQVVSSQSATHSFGPKYGLKERWSAQALNLVLLNTPSGEIGFNTEDEGQTDFDLSVSFDFNNFLLPGLKSNTTLINYSRNVKKISLGGLLDPVEPQGERLRTTWESPNVLDDLLGLKVKKSQNCYARPEANLCTHVSLVADRFDGLLLHSSIRSPSDVNIVIARPQGEKEISKVDPLVQLLIQNKPSGIAAKLITPWKNNYTLTSQIADATTTYELQLRKWKAVLNDTKTGYWQHELNFATTSGIQLAAAFDYDSSAYSYRLEVNSSGKILPFKIKSVSKGFNIWDSIVHSTSIYTDAFGNVTFIGNIVHSMGNNHLMFNRTLETSLIYEKPDGQKIGVELGLKIDGAQHNSSSYTSETQAWLHFPLAPSFRCDLFVKRIIEHRGFGKPKQSNIILFSMPFKGIGATTEVEWDLGHSQYTQNIHFRTSLRTSSDALNRTFELTLSASHSQLVLFAKLDASATHQYCLNSVYNFPSSHCSVKIEYPQNQTVAFQARILPAYDGSIVNIVFNPEVYVNAKKRFSIMLSASADMSNRDFSLAYSAYRYDEDVANLLVNISAECFRKDFLRSTLNIDLPFFSEETAITTALLITFLNGNFNTQFHAILGKTQKMGLEMNQIISIPWFNLLDTNVTFYGLNPIKQNKADFLIIKMVRPENGHVRTKLHFDGKDWLEIIVKSSRIVAAPLMVTVSEMYSITPKIENPYLNGLFFKRTTETSVTPTEFKWKQFGEYNTNKGHGPGMPFRFGVEYTHEPDFKKGQVNVFVEDSNFGKLTDFELFEVLYEYELTEEKSQHGYAWNKTKGNNFSDDENSISSEAEKDDDDDDTKNDPDNKNDDERFEDPDDDTYGDDDQDNDEDNHHRLKFVNIQKKSPNTLVFDSIAMVNWRRFLGRGVVGTQGTLKANISADLSECSAELTTELIDELQSKFVVLFNWLQDGGYLTVTTTSRLEDEMIHEAKLQLRNWLQELNITAVVPKLNVTVNVEANVKLPSQCTDQTPTNIRWNSTARYPRIGSILYSYAVFGDEQFIRGIIKHNERNLVLVDMTAASFDFRYKFRLSSDAHIFPIDFQTRLNLSNLDRLWQGLDVRLNLPNHLFYAELSDLRWYFVENGLKYSGQLKLKSPVLGWNDAELSSSMSILPGVVPIIDFSTVFRNENKTVLKSVVILDKDNSPNLEIYINFEQPLLGFNELEYYLWIPKRTDKFILKNRFHSRPILLNYDIRANLEDNIFFNRQGIWRYSSRKQLFDVTLKITDPGCKNHSASFFWALNRNLRRLPYSFKLKASVDSDLLYTGAIETSTEHVFGYHPYLRGKLMVGNLGPLLFDLKCSSSELEPNCSLTLTNAENSSFKRMLFQFGGIKDRHYTMRLNFDDEHHLDVVFSPLDANALTTKLKINKALVFNSTIKATTQANNTDWVLAVKSFSTIYLTEDQKPVGVDMNFTLKKGNSSIEADAEIQLGNSSVWKATYVFSSEKIALNFNFEPLASTDFRYNRKYHVMGFKSHLFAAHKVEFESNIFYLIYALVDIDTSLLPPNKFYYISIFENTVMLELDKMLTANLIFELKDLPQPLIFRAGYLWINKPLEQLLRLEFEMDEPKDCKFMIGAGFQRVAPGSSQFSLLTAISNEPSIPKTFGNYTLAWLTNGHILETRLYFKSIQTLDTSLIVDSTKGLDRVTVIVLLPPGLELPSFNATATQTFWPNPRMPFELVYQSEFRKSRIGLELADEKYIFEFSWSKLTQRTLLITLEPGRLVIDAPRRVVIVGFKQSPFWNVSLQTQWKGDQALAKHAFIQLSGGANFQVQIKSNLLNKPLSTHFNSAPNNLLWRLQQGTFEHPIATVYEVEYNQNNSKYPQVYTYLALKCGNKTIILDSISHEDATNYQFDSNVTVGVTRETVQMQYIPFERFYLKLNNATLVSMNTSLHTELRTTDFAVNWVKPSVSVSGNLYFTKYPLDYYLRLAGKYKEGLVRLKMTDIFDLVGEISIASPNKEPVTYIKLKSFLNESNIYHLQTLWKEGAYAYLMHCVVDQLDLLGTWAYFKEDMSKLVVDNFQILRSLVNETSLHAFVNSVVEDFDMAFTSLTDGQVDGLRPLRQINFDRMMVYLGKMKEKMVILVNDIFMPRVPRRVLNRALQAAFYIQHECQHTFWSIAKATSNPIDLVSGYVGKKVEWLWLRLSNWDGWVKIRSLTSQLWSRIRAEDPDFVEALESLTRYLESIYLDIREVVNRFAADTYSVASYLVENEWLFDWSQLSIWRMLQTYFRPETTSFAANWKDCDTNSTIYLPKPVRKIVSAVFAQLFKRPSREAGPLEHFHAVANVRDIIAIEDKMRTFSPYWEYLIGTSFDAFLFVNSINRAHLITFDGVGESFIPYRGQRYLLLRDIVATEMVLVASFTEQGVHFEFSIANRTFSVNGDGEFTVDRGPPQNNVEYAITRNSFFANTNAFWKVYVSHHTEIAFVKAPKMLHVRTKLGKHGHLIGLLGNNDNDRITDGRSHLNSYLGAKVNQTSWILDSQSRTPLYQSSQQVYETFKMSRFDDEISWERRDHLTPYIAKKINDFRTLIQSTASYENETEFIPLPFACDVLYGIRWYCCELITTPPFCEEVYADRGVRTDLLTDEKLYVLTNFKIQKKQINDCLPL